MYWAFISYSHKDAAFGRHLHRRLEGYVFPRRLTAERHSDDPLPRRLVPIFRDRDELSAANDLSTAVHTALERSRTLVVVCSPATVHSKWVEREVAAFRMLYPERPIFAAVLRGDPAEVIPSALRQESDGRTIEPLAADFREEGDGQRLALLKLLAGIADINLDTLVRRDTQRRIRRVMAVTAGALMAVLAMGILTAFALNERAYANHQRAEAEGLVEFMLTDLRTTLKGVGRLDAMAAVNARALRYYSDQDLATLPPSSLGRRMRILHAMGEDDETRGDNAAALAKFLEARRTTAALLKAAPNDPERIFDQAQSEYWIGQVAYVQGRFEEARRAFLAYNGLADRMLSFKPDDSKYLREKGYAEGNLCAIYLNHPRQPAAALKACSSALRYQEEVSRRLPTDSQVAQDLVDYHAWLADAYYINNDKSGESTHRHLQEKILLNLIQHDPKNMLLKSRWIAVQLILARIEADASSREKALARLAAASAISDKLVAFDPSNKEWVDQKQRIEAIARQISQEGSERR
jgi:tetratricopeptide (TPR) repeat protein